MPQDDFLPVSDRLSSVESYFDMFLPWLQRLHHGKFWLFHPDLELGIKLRFPLVPRSWRTSVERGRT